jgi:hypothetical protein
VEKTTTIKNPGPKLVWLRLNSGEYVPLPAGKSSEVSSVEIEGNEVLRKLKAARRVHVVAGAAVPDDAAAEHARKRMHPRAPEVAETAGHRAEGTPSRKDRR